MRSRKYLHTPLAEVVQFCHISHGPSLPASTLCPVLPSDILVIIIDYIQDTSLSTLPSLREANSELRTLAIYSQHRYLNLDINRDHVKDTSNELLHLEHHGLLNALRSLNINSPCGSHQYDEETRPYYASTVARLAEILPRMPGLKTIAWNGVIPQEVLAQLSKCHNVKLDLEYRGLGAQVAAHSLSRLTEVSHLRSLIIAQGYVNGPECCGITAALKAVLLNCSNLRHLAIDIHLPRGGCKKYRRPTEYCGFGLLPGERPPPLEMLDLRHFPQLPANPSAESEYHSWAKNWDWSKLRRLVASLEFATLLAPKLTAIEEIELYHEGPHAMDDVLELLQLLPRSLSAVSLPTSPYFDETLLGLREHASLTSLQLHWYENMRVFSGPDPDASRYTWYGRAEELASNLPRLREACPLLETLALDVPRNGMWPYPVLDELAKFPNLTHLTIWFELGVYGGREQAQPKVVFSEISPLFRYIRERQTSQRLQHLIVHSGAPVPRAAAGMPTGRAMWFDRSTTSFTCTLSERADEAARNQTVTRCPNLSAANNIRLARGEDTAEDGVFRLRINDEETRRFYAGYQNDREKREYGLAKNGPKPVRAQR